jgi:restriction system protein
MKKYNSNEFNCSFEITSIRSDLFGRTANEWVSANECASSSENAARGRRVPLLHFLIQFGIEKKDFIISINERFLEMASSRSSPLERFVDTFVAYPWWVSVSFGGFMIVVLKFAAYSVAAGHPAYRPVAATLGSMWWIPAIVCTGTAILSKVLEKRHRAALARHFSLQTLREVPWREFESLVAAYYREQGFTALENPEPGPDGGCDLVMWKNGERTLVQCKRLRDRKVTVQQVREFFGVVVASGAARGVFVTTSEFTPEAMEFGLRQAALELIPGQRLVQLIQGLRPSSTDSEFAPLDESRPPVCPKCAEPMVRRVARQGRALGSEFWGCTRFPSCRGTLQLEITCESVGGR